MNEYIICGIFPSLAAVEIPHEHGDLVLVEYDRVLPRDITHAINNVTVLAGNIILEQCLE